MWLQVWALGLVKPVLSGSHDSFLVMWEDAGGEQQGFGHPLVRAIRLWPVPVWAPEGIFFKLEGSWLKRQEGLQYTRLGVGAVILRDNLPLSPLV